jgi:hypothetical protein
MTPEEVAQYIAEYPRKNFIPGDQAVVKGEGAVPRCVPAQKPGYVWELVDAISTSVYEQWGYPKAYRIARPERWDSLYQYQKENQVDTTKSVEQLIETRLRSYPGNGSSLSTGYTLIINVAGCSLPLEVADLDSGTWMLISAKKDLDFVTVRYALNRPQMHCMTVRIASGAYVEVYNSRTPDKQALLNRVAKLNAEVRVVKGPIECEESNLFSLREVGE